MEKPDVSCSPLDDTHVPDDEAVTVPDLSKVFGDDDDEGPDPFDPDFGASDAHLPDDEGEAEN